MEEKVTTILDRLEELIAAKQLSFRAFSSSIGVPPMTLSSMLKRRSDPSSLFIATILSVYSDVSPDWIMLGKGSMLKSDKAPHSTEKTPIAGNAIKYYPSVSGSMGGIEFLDNPDEFYTDIILPGFSECKFAVNAYGDSMYPVIKNGQIVVMMPWIERFIDWGHIYMVVTKSGYRAIKYLKPSTQEGFVTCESENKENNPAFDIEMEDIHRLYLVKGWICKDAI